MTGILSSGSVAADVNWPHPEFLPGQVALINSALGQKLPGDEDPPRAQFKSKAAVVEYVEKSFADGAAAIKSKGDSGISDLVIDPFGYEDLQHAGKAQVRLVDLAHNLVEHSGEVYGQLSVYYRVAGMIPPSRVPRNRNRRRHSGCRESGPNRRPLPTTTVLPRLSGPNAPNLKKGEG